MKRMRWPGECECENSHCEVRAPCILEASWHSKGSVYVAEAPEGWDTHAFRDPCRADRSHRKLLCPGCLAEARAKDEAEAEKQKARWEEAFARLEEKRKERKGTP